MDAPFRKEQQPDPAVNIIQQALRLKAYLKTHPDETALMTAHKIGIHRKRIPKLMTILERAPATLQKKLYNCPDNRVHRTFNLRTLHRIAQLDSKE